MLELEAVGGDDPGIKLRVKHFFQRTQILFL
jgi:hypothetical protein